MVYSFAGIRGFVSLRSRAAFMSFLIAAILIQMPAAAGAADDNKIISYNIQVDLYEDLKTHHSIRITFDSPVNRLEYELDFDIFNFSVYKNFDGIADCQLTRTQDKSLISCDIIGMEKERTLIRFDFDSMKNIKRKGEDLLFIARYDSPLFVERLSMKALLPAGNILKGKNLTDSCYPQDCITGSQLGKNIIVFWETGNITGGDNIEFSIAYKGQPIDTPLLIGLTIIIISAMVGIAFYVRKVSRSKPADVVASVLKEDEKTIIDILNKRDGRTSQKQIVRESGFSKAKVSRLMKDLKSRGIIDIEPISGRENRIILKLKSLAVKKDEGREGEPASPPKESESS